MWTSDLLPELTPTGQPVVYSDMTVRLREDDARTLAQDLRALFERALKLDVPVGSTKTEQGYLCMVALLPVAETYGT